MKAEDKHKTINVGPELIFRMFLWNTLFILLAAPFTFYSYYTVHISHLIYSSQSYSNYCSATWFIFVYNMKTTLCSSRTLCLSTSSTRDTIRINRTRKKLNVQKRSEGTHCYYHRVRIQRGSQVVVSLPWLAWAFLTKIQHPMVTFAILNPYVTVSLII